MNITINPSLEIFNLPNVKRQVEKIFKETEASFRNRFNEIKNFIVSKDSQEDYSEIKLENVLLKFKDVFYSKIVMMAVENALSTKNHDLESNLISLLSKENVEKAIAGETMIEAFSDVIREIPTDSAVVATLNGSKIFLIRKQFLGVNSFSWQSDTNTAEDAHATVVREEIDALMPWITEDIDG